MELIGKRFGGIVVLSISGKNSKGTLVTIQCDCGKVKQVYKHHVMQERYISCGCKRIKHGHVGNKNRTPTYITWQSIKARCLYLSAKGYDRYGEAGISICERWINSFENFLQDMGERPPKTTIDRINNEKGYEPENCRWASIEVQANNKRSNRIISYKGTTQTLSQWAKQLGVSTSTLCGRLLLSDLDGAIKYLNSDKYHRRPNRSKHATTEADYNSR